MARVNPARAGMIRTSPGSAAREMRKPRASGDDPDLCAMASEADK